MYLGQLKTNFTSKLAVIITSYTKIKNHVYTFQVIQLLRFFSIQHKMSCRFIKRGKSEKNLTK